MPSTGTPLPWDRGNGPCVMAPPPFEGLGGRGRRLSFPPGHGRNHSLRHLRLFRFSAQSHFVYPPRPGHMRARGIGTFYMRKAGTGAARCLYGMWGGAMIYLRAALAGTAVHTLRGKWCPQAYADLMKSSGARWSSLVPTQVVDLVSLDLRAPSTAGCIIVGGGALDTETGRKARTLGWPVVQSYGMTEAGSQLATAPSRRFLPYGPPFPSAPLGSSDGQRRPPALPGERQIVRPPADAGSWRVPSGKSRSAGVVEHPRPECAWKGVC